MAEVKEIQVYKREDLKVDRITGGRTITYHARISSQSLEEPVTIERSDLHDLVDALEEFSIYSEHFTTLPTASLSLKDRYWDQPLDQKEFSTFSVLCFRKFYPMASSTI